MHPKKATADLGVESEAADYKKTPLDKSSGADIKTVIHSKLWVTVLSLRLCLVQHVPRCDQQLYQLCPGLFAPILRRVRHDELQRAVQQDQVALRQCIIIHSLCCLEERHAE